MVRAASPSSAQAANPRALFASSTKPELAARGLEGLRALAASCPAPIYGIGGVTVDNAGEVIAAGAAGVAVSSAVLDASDVEGATRALVEAVARARRGGAQ